MSPVTLPVSAHFSWPRLIGLWLLVSAQGCWAGPGGGVFSISEARSLLVDGVLRVSAQVDFQLGDQAKEALNSGVPLVLELKVEVREGRQWMWDALVGDLRQRHEVRYHALSRQYVVRNVATGVRQSFYRLDDALRAVGTVYDLPVLDQKLLNPALPHTVRLRAGLDIESLPTPVRLWAYVSRDWGIESEWHEWPLEP